MVHQCFIRSAVLCVITMSVISSSVLCAEEAKSKHKLPKFPFPVNIDKGEGETEGLPNRIQDKDSGMWYRLVPQGTYTIGSNKLADSKEIQVRLSPYYISETCVSYAQVAQYLLKELNKELEEKGRLEETFSFIKEMPQALQADYQQLYQMWKLSSLEFYWEKMLRLDSTLAKKCNQEFSLAWQEATYKKKTIVYEFGNKNFFNEINVFKEFKLSSEQKESFKKVIATLTKKLTQQQKNHSPYGHTLHENASEYAEFRGVSLPTEAQWEAAARLAATGKLKVANMVGHHREWCSDYYAYDYFKRKNHFDDPTGPLSGKLSGPKNDSATPEPGLTFLSVAESFLVVLRGETGSKRQYRDKTFFDFPANFKRPRRIRLVINMTKK